MEQDFNTIINSGQLVLVDFYATWCVPCQRMHPVLEEIKEKHGDAIRILKIDVEKNESFATQHRVQAVPTLMLFRNGEPVWRQSGVLEVGELSGVIQQYL